MTEQTPWDNPNVPKKPLVDCIRCGKKGFVMVSGGWARTCPLCQEDKLYGVCRWCEGEKIIFSDLVNHSSRMVGVVCPHCKGTGKT